MSTCPQILEALPGVLAGEPDEAGVHAHLALCPTCRGEADALTTDLERVREGLGALGRRVTRRADAYAGPARTRTIGWLPVAAGLAALVIGGFWLGRHLRDDSGPATPMAAAPVGSEHGFRSVATLLARHDAPRVLQVRMTQEGTLCLRAYRLGSEQPPEILGPWQLGTQAQPDVTLGALRALSQALESARLVPAGVDSPRDVSLREGARIVIDAEDEVPWRYVQWVLALGSSPSLRFYRITFLTPPDGVGLDLDLPADVPAVPGAPATHLDLPAVKLFRKEGTPSPAADFTRVRLGDEQTWDLPPTVGEATDRALGALKSMLAARIKQAASEKPPRILVKTPPPAGARVPTGDVLRVLDAIRRAGVEEIRLEGAPPPLGAEPSGAGAR